MLDSEEYLRCRRRPLAIGLSTTTKLYRRIRPTPNSHQCASQASVSIRLQPCLIRRPRPRAPTRQMAPSLRSLQHQTAILTRAVNNNKLISTRAVTTRTRWPGNTGNNKIGSSRIHIGSSRTRGSSRSRRIITNLQQGHPQANKASSSMSRIVS